MENSRLSLSFRHAGLNGLNLTRPKPRRGPLMLRPGDAGRSNGGLEVIDRRGDAGAAFPGRGRRHGCLLACLDYLTGMY